MTDIRFINRLNELVEWDKTNLKNLADRAGVGYDTVREIIRGRTKSISVDSAKAILDALGLSFREIYDDAESSFSEKEQQPFIGVPRYRAHLSAGHGATDAEESDPIDHIPFTPEFFSKKLGRKNVDGLVVCEVKGESMEPTVSNGDLAMVTSDYDGEKSGLYAVNYGEETLIKRLERIPDGYRLISDNPLYPVIEVRGSDLDKFRVIGEVIWIGRTL